MQPTAVADVFALLETLLRGSRIAFDGDAKPIVFDVVDQGRSFLFDPRSRRSLICAVEESPAQAALVLHCSSEVFVRLVKDCNFRLHPSDTAWFEGDLRCLQPIVSALAQTRSFVDVRGVQ